MRPNCSFLEYSQVQNSVMGSIPAYFNSFLGRKKLFTYRLVVSTSTKYVTSFSSLSMDLWMSVVTHRV